MVAPSFFFWATEARQLIWLIFCLCSRHSAVERPLDSSLVQLMQVCDARVLAFEVAFMSSDFFLLRNSFFFSSYSSSFISNTSFRFGVLFLRLWASSFIWRVFSKIVWGFFISLISFCLFSYSIFIFFSLLFSLSRSWFSFWSSNSFLRFFTAEGSS